MRHYCKLPVDLFGENRIIDVISSEFHNMTNPRIHENNVIFFEGCYLSKRVFDVLTRSCWTISRNECMWRPASMHSLITIIYDKVEIHNETFYQIKVISEGAQTISFVAVSRIEDFFFVFEDEDTTEIY